MDPVVHLTHQKKRNFGGKRQKAITQEVDKYLIVGFVREVIYPAWLVNVVMFKKNNGK